MRQDGNPLDLNNLPEEYGKQGLEESSTTTAASSETARFKKKKGGGKDDGGKVYECRFCSLKFCKSQALGGHMNRHRQERETETLNRARQLVFSNEGLAGVGTHVGLRDLGVGGSQSIPPSGSFPQRGGIGEQCLQFHPVYPRHPMQQPPSLQQYIYPSSSSYPVSFPPPHPPSGEYFIGRALGGSSHRQPQSQNHGIDSNYTCFGAPLTQTYPIGARPTPPSNQGEGVSWNYSYGHGQHMDSSSSMDRFRENF